MSPMPSLPPMPYNAAHPCMPRLGQSRVPGNASRRVADSGKNGNVRQHVASPHIPAYSALAASSASQNLDFRQKRQCRSPAPCARVPSHRTDVPHMMRTRAANLNEKADTLATEKCAFYAIYAVNAIYAVCSSSSPFGHHAARNL